MSTLSPLSRVTRPECKVLRARRQVLTPLPPLPTRFLSLCPSSSLISPGASLFFPKVMSPPPTPAHTQPLLPTNPDSHLQGRRGRLRTLLCVCAPEFFFFFMIAFKYCLRHLRLCDRASPCVCVSEQMLVGSRECVRRCRGKSWLYLENSVRWSTLSHADGTVKCLGGGRGGGLLVTFSVRTQGGRHLRVAATCHARPPCVLAGRGKKRPEEEAQQITLSSCIMHAGSLC